MINFNKKQKYFIIGITSFLLVFAIFIGFSYFYANRNSTSPYAKDDTEAYNDTVTVDSTSTIEPKQGDSIVENINNTPDNENTNTKQESENTDKDDASNPNNASNTDNSSNTNNTPESSASGTKPNTSNTASNETVQSSIDNNTQNDVSNNENYKFVINVQIKDVNSLLLFGTVKSNKSLTAYEALEIFAQESNFEIKKSGSGSLSYVTSINGLKEKDNGPSSGWMYKVNGSFPGSAAGKYTLNSGDTLEWVYTHNGGKDVGSR